MKEFHVSEKQAMEELRSFLSDFLKPPGQAARTAQSQFTTFVHTTPDMSGFSAQEQDLFAQLDRYGGRLKLERFYERNPRVPRPVLDKVFKYFEEMVEAEMEIEDDMPS